MIATAINRRFKPVRCLGEGAMGVVYEAIDVEHGTHVALKTLRHMTSVQGDRSGAAVLLRSAIDLGERVDMFGHAHAARYQLGLLIGGAEGEALARQAAEAMAAQGVREPGRIAHMLVPGRWRGDSTATSAVGRVIA